MNKSDARIILGKVPKSLTGWDRAIQDAEQKISETKNRLAKLKAALSLFKERRESGEQFSCEKSKRRSLKARQDEE